MRMLRIISAGMLTLAAVACSNVESPTEPTDANSAVPSYDGGFGLGSGGYTGGTTEPESTSSTNHEPEENPCETERGGFGLGSGGRSEGCVTDPTL